MIPPTSRTTLIAATLIAATVGGCASAPPKNSQLTRLESELKAAYNDKYVAEYGNADLERAEAALAAARTAGDKRLKDEVQHELAMAEGYIALGHIHGRQERVKAETVALKTRQEGIRLSARDRDVRAANDRAEMSRVQAGAANRAAADARAATQSAEDRLAALRTQLSEYEMRVTELGATLVLRDVMFDVNSARLRSGAVNRLDPLVAYLRAYPDTKVRIDGHTDSSGSAAYNEELSLNRADSVRRALQSGGGVYNDIEIHGYGQANPVASNSTVSGREQNRRVEITLR